MSKLKPGDKVRVVTYEEAMELYKDRVTKRDILYRKIPMPFGYVSNAMDKWLGKIVTIKTINTASHPSDGYAVTLEEAIFNWHIDMFKPLKKPISLKGIQ